MQSFKTRNFLLFLLGVLALIYVDTDYIKTGTFFTLTVLTNKITLRNIMEKEEWFWSLIEKSRKGKQRIKHQVQINNLIKELKKLSATEISEFNLIFNSLLSKSYRWDLWGAAYIINGGCSNDTFDYFRSWLIGQGKEMFYKALHDPESLTSLISHRLEYDWEGLEYCAAEAYEAKTGEDIYSAQDNERSVPSFLKEPMGEEWKEEDLPTRFPKLWEAFHDYKKYDESTDIKPKEVDPCSFTGTFNMSEIPHPSFWIDYLAKKGHVVGFRILGEAEKPVDKIPYPDYSSYLIQLKKRIPRNQMGILIKSVSINGGRQVKVIFENYDKSTSKVFHELSILVASQKEAEIKSGNVIFGSRQWFNFIENGKLPD